MTKNGELKNCTDDELIEKIRIGDSAAMDFICDKYKVMVRSKAKSMFILGADREDLIQEGMLGLFKAIRDYDMGRDASFYTFAELCINRQMYTAVQASQRKKHIPLNSYISLDNSGDDENAQSVLETEFLDKMGMNPEQVILDNERVEYLNQLIAQELSEFEKQVLDLYITGMSYSQIAKVLARDEKSTDNALQRLKAKIKKHLQDELV
ncbi:MAG: RNA polymerase sporulation sigma factor SigH [Lachnospiraceae bacterium]|nr:RNA polymerase sporulation sigma factor SigH [Lachnospiraceae bacterium]